MSHQIWRQQCHHIDDRAEDHFFTQLSTWCKFGVLYEVPASMHDSSTSDQKNERSGCLCSTCDNEVNPRQDYD